MTNLVKKKQLNSPVYWILIVTSILYFVPFSYKLYQINQYNEITLSNYEHLNQFKLVLNNCLNKAAKKAVDLKYRTLSTTFIIGGNFQQLSKSIALIESQITEWHGKITFGMIYLYAKSELNETQTLEIYSKTKQLFANTSIIISTDVTNVMNPNINLVSEDVLIVLDYNITTNLKCIFNNVLNTTIGSIDWIIRKTMHSDGWELYRLSDMIHLKEYREKEDGYKYHKEHFPNSIAVYYMDLLKRLINKNINSDNLLLRIMSTQKQLYPSNNTLVIHLRTGDVLDDVCEWNIISNYKLMLRLLDDPIEVFTKSLPQFKHHNLSEAVIVTGFHSEGNHTNSANYIRKIKEWFELNNFTVSFRINENPDEDFLFMCNTKYFFQSAGGFSHTIARIVKKRNGIVFNYGHAGFFPKTETEKQLCFDAI